MGASFEAFSSIFLLHPPLQFWDSTNKEPSAREKERERESLRAFISIFQFWILCQICVQSVEESFVSPNIIALFTCSPRKRERERGNGFIPSPYKLSPRPITFCPFLTFAFWLSTFDLQVGKRSVIGGLVACCQGSQFFAQQF